MSAAPTEPEIPVPAEGEILASVEGAAAVAAEPTSPGPAAGGWWLVAARDILLIVGVITIVTNAVHFVQLGPIAGEEIEHSLLMRRASLSSSRDAEASANLDTAEARHRAVWEAVVQRARIGAPVAVGAGVLLVILGVLVQKLPVPITVAGLVLYLGSTAVQSRLDPQAPMQETKVIASIAVALGLAILAALGARRAASATPRPSPVDAEPGER